MAPSCSESAPNCLSWYASPTDSDGPRTSDLSPVSGYFDWSQSSNNTSPMQYDETVCQPSPIAVHSPSRIAQVDQQSPFMAGYPNIRRPTSQQAQSTSDGQQRGTFVENYPHPQEVTGPIDEDPITYPTGRLSPSPKADPSAESNAMEEIENEDSANSRSGKRWKAAHRAVERRYRSNLNLKIIKLGQCIPAIRSQVTGIDTLDGCQTNSKTKLQKGHVLSKAVDYIQSLQQVVSDLEADKKELENRVEALHVMVDEYHAPTAMVQASQSAGLSKQSPEPLNSLGSSPRKGSSVAMKNADERRLSSEAQNPLLRNANGFSFVSENPSLTSKRPRVAKGVGPRPSSG
jgi:Helix-loop-helix DNA-binding domain